MSDEYHVPVLGRQTIDLLVTSPDGIYIDMTLGGGGHSRLIIERLSPQGTLIGCDRDPDSIEHARHVLPSSVSVQLLRTPFTQLRRHLSDTLAGRVSGVLMDLGVSSHQLDQARRGFSHRFASPLDLRMDPTQGETAAELIARLDAGALRKLIHELGEEPQAARIAKAIIRERDRTPIDTTDHLERIVSAAAPQSRMKSLARVFQALRMEINHELDELAAGLDAAWQFLAASGRLVVISYHSLEDRMVKHFMNDKAHPPDDRRVPVPVSRPADGRLLTRKPLVPDLTEISQNPRARSAKLRAIEKTR